MLLAALVACLVACSLAGAPRAVRAGDALPGLVMGVSAIEPEREEQVDGLRNVEIWAYFYNASPRPIVLDWRTRRLRSHDLRRTALNSRDDYDGTLELNPGQLYLFHPTFYSKEGMTRKYVLSIRDDAQRIYQVPTTPGATNVGPFDKLPEPIQKLLIDAFLDSPQHRWWWRQY